MKESTATPLLRTSVTEEEMKIQIKYVSIIYFGKDETFTLELVSKLKYVNAKKQNDDNLKLKF